MDPAPDKEPPLKRKRKSEASAPETTTVSLKDAVRDEKFYLSEAEGADCVIFAGGTLFRVHKFLLARDCSAFRDMFNASSNERSGEGIGSATEGTSDGNPIILPDTPAHLRALLWVLYALPKELQQQQDATFLLALFTITHKYHFESTQTWAREALMEIVEEQEFWKDSSGPVAVLEAAILCDDRALEEITQRLWIREILSKRLPPTPALLLADKHRMERLLGVAYYVLVLGQIDLPVSQAIPPQLSRDQRARLLSGCFSIRGGSTYSLPGGLNGLEYDNMCKGGPSCTQSGWCTKAWGNILRRYSPYTLQQLESSYETEVKVDSPWPAGWNFKMSKQCREEGLSKIRNAIDKQMDGLLETYFTDLTDPCST
ncbi:hypothetical protein FIBSPDRAFT_574497 [Athelia psychrophila]|uniref:BTB domain-containing protein n=1 Tax=Athelia psychrophila TaxID=1759441 RepID=A0A166HJC7_9AGAM|nr:hypothetical protein FIBSPDRAFT_574497 [Fibularhizoctonia sp. CBS 109695]